MGAPNSDNTNNLDENKTPRGYPYKVLNGRLTWMKSDGDSVTPRALCNFNAWIVSEEMRDDGINQKRFFRIEGRLFDGTPLHPALVSAEEFASLSWVTRVWGAKALVFPGQAIRDHLRAAIQILSDCKTIHAFAHTGWRKTGEDWKFLHAHGAIGASGNDESVVLNLSPALASYAFPDPSKHKDDIADAVRSSLDLLSLGDRIGFVLLGTVYLAPLTEALPPDFSIFFAGATGSFKSCATALDQAHFGPTFNDRNLPGSWSSTPNALEKLTSLAKSCVLTIDDFKPGNDRNENAELFRKADRIFRGVGNQSGRGRLTSDAELKASPIPRCIVIASGEDIPPGHSCRARLLILEIRAGDILCDVLTRLQGHAQEGKFALSMAAYIQWVAKRFDHLKSTLPIRHKALRLEIQSKGRHFRMLDAIAKLLVALETFSDFAIEVGVFSTDEQDQFLARARAILIAFGASQDDHQTAEDPCTAVLDGIRSLLSGGNGSSSSGKRW